MKVIVVAHPDDESLWLSSVLASAERVVFCFGAPFERPKMAEARRRAVAALPLAGLVDLKLPESGGGFSVDWENPQLTETGIAISDPQVRGRYDANYARLVEALRPVLAGCAELEFADDGAKARGDFRFAIMKKTSCDKGKSSESRCIGGFMWCERRGE